MMRIAAAMKNNLAHMPKHQQFIDRYCKSDQS